MISSKVLYITFDGLTDPLGQSQILPYLLKLAELNYEFTVLSFEKKEKYLQTAPIIRSKIKNKKVSWIPLTFHSFPPLFSKFYDFKKAESKIKEILRVKNIDLIHCRSYQAALLGLAIKKKFGIPFIFDMRGYWIEERVEGGLWNLKNPLYLLLYRYFKKQEKTLLQESDHIITLTHLAKKELSNRDLKIAPISVIPCAVDFNEFCLISKDSRERAKKELNIPQNALIIGYLGSVGTWYLLKEMLDFFQVVQAKYRDSYFLFVTPEKEKYIYSMAAKSGISSKYIRVTFAPREKVAEKMAAVDIAIFFIKQSFSKSGSSPTKLGELFSLGLPVIANNSIGDIADHINQNNGILLNQFTPEAYQYAVDEISSLQSKNAKQIRSLGYDVFNIDQAVETYNTAYQSILE